MLPWSQFCLSVYLTALKNFRNNGLIFNKTSYKRDAARTPYVRQTAEAF